MVQQIGAVLREAFRSTVAQPVFAIVSVLVVMGMVVAVLLTTGRTIAAEQQVLASIDDAGTRVVTVRLTPDAGVGADAIARIERLEDVEWIAGFGPAADVSNAWLPEGKLVQFRSVYGGELPTITARMDEQPVYIDNNARIQLGLEEYSGALVGGGFTPLVVMGRSQLPAFLDEMTPLVVAPRIAAPEGEPLALIKILARSPEAIAPLTRVLTPLLAAGDPTGITLETSEQLVELRTLVGGQLGDFSRALVFLILGVSAALVAIIQCGFVMLRRRDFGRRRALGATRGLIVVLVLGQSLIVACAGALAGVMLTVLGLLLSAQPLPGVPFIVAVALLSVLAAVAAAVVPAIVASRREPIRELRVP